MFEQISLRSFVNLLFMTLHLHTQSKRVVKENRVYYYRNSLIGNKRGREILICPCLSSWADTLRLDNYF